MPPSYNASPWQRRRLPGFGRKGFGCIFARALFVACLHAYRSGEALVSRRAPETRRKCRTFPIAKKIVDCFLFSAIHCPLCLGVALRSGLCFHALEF